MVLDRKRFPTPDLKGCLTPMLKTYNGFIAHIQSSLSGPQRPCMTWPRLPFHPLPLCPLFEDSNALAALQLVLQAALYSFKI